MSKSVLVNKVPIYLKDILKYVNDTGINITNQDIINKINYELAVDEFKQKNMENTEQQAQNLEQQKQLTIGEEFIEWAINGWGLDKAYNSANPSEGEGVHFDVIRKYLEEGLDNIVKKRLGI